MCRLKQFPVSTSLVLILISSAAQGMEIVSWNQARGGVSSLSDSSAYASTRSMIAADFPGTSLVGVPSLTSSALTGANVVWIASGFGDSVATTPLTTNEQAALLAFVQGGGTAVLFGENDTFASNASAANNSFFSPFGAHNTGTLGGTQAYSLASPGSFPLTGPFGQVAALSSNYPGWFDTLPAGSAVVADLAGNRQPVIASIPAGALGPGSGAVWLFGDTGAQSAGGVDGAGWNTLYANILSQVPEPGGLGILLMLGLSTLRRPSRH